MFLNNTVFILVDAVCRNEATNAGNRINLRITPDHSARIQNAVAADFRTVTYHRADFFATGFQRSTGLLDHDKGFITLDIAGNRACTHMSLITQNRISDIIVVRDLNGIKQNNIFQLHRVADNRIFAHDCTLPDKGAVSHFSPMINNTGRTNKG